MDWTVEFFGIERLDNSVNGNPRYKLDTLMVLWVTMFRILSMVNQSRLQSIAGTM